MGNIANAHRAGDGCRQGLKVRDFALLSFLVFLPHHNSDRVPKATQIDESKIEGEESSARNQKDHNKRQLQLADRDRYENNIGRDFGEGAKRLVDRLVDTQDSLRVSGSRHSSSE